MTSQSLVRASLRCLVAAAAAFAVLPVAACFEDHPIGEDLKDSGTAAADGGKCAEPTDPCSEPDILPGCVLGPSTCVDGVYRCPTVTCPDVDAGGSCTNDPVCSEPPIPSGCTLGPTRCVNGVNLCPEVICPGEDAGSCSGGSQVCHEPNVPVGCHLGPAGCVDGVYQCPAVVCPPDAGSDGGQCIDVSIPAGGQACNTASDCNLVRTGLVCSGQCSCGDTPVNNAASSQIQSELAGLTLEACPCAFPGQAECIQGTCTLCGPGPNQPAGCGDGGTTTVVGFACGGPTGPVCNPATEYCSIVEGGAVNPDSGKGTMSANCDPIPTECANDPAGAAATCACIQSKTSGQCAVSNGSDLTVTIEAP
jgi:hypothetical protein